MRLPFADRFRPGWLAAWAAIGLLCGGQHVAGVLDGLDAAWAAQGLAAAAPPRHDGLVLVEITDASLGEVGPWPWSHEVHARLIDQLTAAQAALVVHTVPFVRPESREALAQLRVIANAVATDPQLAEHPRLGGLLEESRDLLDADARLALSLAQNGRTVLSVAEGPAARVDWPMAQLSSAALGVGRQPWPGPGDAPLRAVPLRSRADGRELPSLALWVAASAAGRHPAELSLQPGRAVLGTHRWPVDDIGQVRPAWRAATARPGVDRIDAARLLAGQVAPARLAGRTVLVGVTSAALEAPAAVAGAGPLSRLDVLAQASAALLDDRLVERPAWVPLAQYGGAAVAAVLVMLGGPLLALPSLAAIALLLSAALLSGAYLAMSHRLIELPVMLPLLSLWLGLGAFTLGVRAHRRARAAPRASLLPVEVASPAPGPGALSLSALPDVPPSHAPTVPSMLPGETGAQPRPAAPPRRRLPALGGFQLLREIGRGSMGRVYLAEQVGTGRPVAVKTLALAREFDGFALHEARLRFQREAMAALRLRHPDIVRVHDAGEDQGYAWIAMELLQGHDLLRHTPAATLLPVPQALAVCARVAGALAHAHAQGVIHRDIKPANVMIDAATGLVKVTDFGIARITDAARTRTGLVLGSPSYMSPEQLAGRAVDGRSDLYSLGVLLFQLLTGSLPAEGASMAALMHAVAHVPAPDVRTLRPRLPEAVANVVALALEKRVELRYASARALQADLLSVLALWAPAERANPFAPDGAPRRVEEVAPPGRAAAAAAGQRRPVVHNGPS